MFGGHTHCLFLKAERGRTVPLLPFLWKERERFRGVKLWRIAGVGLINSAIPFVLFAWATERAPSSIVCCNALARRAPPPPRT